jgi:hypothetical protein
MSNYARRPPLLRRPAQVADPGEMVDLRMEERSWRQGFFRVLCAPSTTETGEVLIWFCTRTSTGRLVGRTAVRLA